MVVVAVIGILMVIGMPTLIGYWRTSTLKAGAQEVVALLNQGRQLAIKENESVCIKSDVANPTYGRRVRYLRGTCTATSTCTATGNASPCIWTGPGTDGSGYVTLSNRIEMQPPSGGDVIFSYLGAASPAGSYRVRMIENPSGTATVAVAASGRTSFTFP